MKHTKKDKAIIVVGYQCNNNCLFCSSGHKSRDFNRAFSEIINDLKKEYLAGCRAVEFIGGEVTVRKDIIDIVHTAHILGYKHISFETNGRMFSNRQFTEKIVKAGLTNLLFSIHGHNAKIHDSLTQVPGSFKQATQGIKQILSFRIPLMTNFVINKLNFRFIGEYLQFISRYGVSNVCLSFVHPQGNAFRNFDLVVPRISEVRPYLLESLNKHDTLNVKVQNMPVCLMGQESDRILKAIDKVNNYMISEEQDRVRLTAELRRLKIKPDRCSECKLIEDCDGIWKAYYDRFGASELTPIKD